VLEAIAEPRKEPGVEIRSGLFASRAPADGISTAEPTFVSPQIVWDFLRRHRWIFAVAVALSLLLGLAFIAVSPPKYRSLARLLIDPQGLLILKNDITHTSDSADANLLDVENQRYVILSRSVLAATVKSGHLEDSPLFGNAPPGLLGRIFGVLRRPTEQMDREDKAVAALADAVEVVRGERAYILDVVVTTRDPKVSADIANLLAKVYLEQEQEAKTQTAKRASGSLNERAAELAHEVQQADEDVESFRLRNSLSFTATGQLLGNQQISDLNAQLAIAKTRTAAAQARVDQLEQIRKTKIDPAQFPEAMQSPVVASLRAQYAQLVQQEASYVMQFGPRHPALVQVREQIQDVRNLINAEVARISQSARVDLGRAKTNEITLERSIDQVRKGLGDNSAVLARLHELERTAEAKKSIYQAVLTRQKELEGQQGIDTSNTRVISDAVPATKASGPPAVLVLAGSLIFGLSAAAGIGFLRDRIRIGPQTQTQTQTKETLESSVGAPFLGSFTGEAVKPGRFDTRAGAKTRDRKTATEILHHLCDANESPRILGFVGLHDDESRMMALAELVLAAEEGDLALGVVDCNSGKMNTEESTETHFGANARPVRSETEEPALVSLADLMVDDPGPLTLRRLRGNLRGYASGKDLVLVNMPAIVDVGMPPVLLEAVDAVVLVIAEREWNRESIDRLLAFVGKTTTPLAGFILTGDRVAS
jgi:uncharacterized protein involved in exopolysaccharide biosynthesis